MNILITGGIGFIGTNLIELLIKTHKIICLDNFFENYEKAMKIDNLNYLINYDNFKFYDCDLSTGNLNQIFDSENIDLIIHLAGLPGVRGSIDNPLLYYQNNVVATLKLLEAAKASNIKKIIFASSSSVYGNRIDLKPFCESDITDAPISFYASTKKSSELIIYNYHHLFNFSCVCLRFFTVIGKRQRPDLALHKFALQLTQGFPITVYGDGTSFRDYTAIEDIIAGINSSINYLMNNKSVYEIINLGSSNPIKLIDFINIIMDEFNLDAEIKHKPNQMGDVNGTFANIDKANRLLGYYPNIPLRQSIRSFVIWYKEYYGLNNEV